MNLEIPSVIRFALTVGWLTPMRLAMLAPDSLILSIASGISDAQLAFIFL